MILIILSYIIRDRNFVTMNLDELKCKIIKNIDHPFFQNNEGFIEAFDTIYKAENDIKILLLMYEKSISFLYHYLYIELCNYYKNTNRELCRYILEKAIKRNVYDQNKIMNEYKKYRNVEYTKSENEYYRILHPKKLALWGREWKPTERQYISTAFSIDKTYVSYAEYVLHELAASKTDKLLNERSNHSFSLNLEKSLTVANYMPRKSEVDLANKKSAELFNNTLFENTRMSEINQKDSLTTDTSEQLVTFYNRIELETYIEIGEHIYFIRENINTEIFSIKRISKNAGQLETIVTEEMCIQKMNTADFDVLKKYSFSFLPVINLKCCNDGMQYIIYKNEEYVTLKTTFKALVHEHGIVNEVVIAYFYLKIYKILAELKSVNLYVQGLLFDNFLRGKNNVLLLCNYNFGPIDNNSEIFDKMLSLTKLKKYKYLENDDEKKIARLEADMEKLKNNDDIGIMIDLLV